MSSLHVDLSKNYIIALLDGWGREEGDMLMC